MIQHHTVWHRMVWLSHSITEWCSSIMWYCGLWFSTYSTAENRSVLTPAEFAADSAHCSEAGQTGSPPQSPSCYSGHTPGLSGPRTTLPLTRTPQEELWIRRDSCYTIYKHTMSFHHKPILIRQLPLCTSSSSLLLTYIFTPNGSVIQFLRWSVSSWM